jgi:hypothetical protein
LPIRTPSGSVVKISQVANITEEPGQLELRREDLPQLVAVAAALEDRDLGSGIALALLFARPMHCLARLAAPVIPLTPRRPFRF